MKTRSTRIGDLAILLAVVFCLCGAAGASNSALLLRDGAELTRPAIDVISSNEGGVRLTIDLPALELGTHDLNGESFHSLGIPGGQLHGEAGEPAFPSFVRYVAIPNQAGVSLNIVSEEETFTGYQLFPMQAPDAQEFQINEEVYRRDEFLGGEAVRVGEPGIMRDLRVIPLIFQPVRYNPATGEIRVVRRVEVAMQFAGVDLRNAKTRANMPLTPGFEQVYRALVVNYDEMRDNSAGEIAPHLGTWLIITPNNGTVIDLILPLIEWRQRMGYNVVHAHTGTTGTSSTNIKAWIQTAYNTWEHPPEFITLVGDASGTIALPTFYENYSGYYNGEGDHPYSELEGGDLIPDAFIGRLSCDNTTTLARIIYKITSYESDPYIEDPDWFGNVTLTGDPSSSGITCVQIQQWIKERLRQYGFADADIDTVFNYPYESQTINNLHQGNSYFGYRGYYGMSGISTGDISALQNGPRLTYAVNLTCGTGSWAGGTSHNEAWLRGGAGTSTITGGIGSIGTATLGTATRYNNCFYGGVAYGLFWEENYRLGISHARGKLEMIINYADYEFSQAARYCYWNTLMGDPATEMWTAFPEPLNVYYNGTLPRGSEEVTITVRDDSYQPVEDAWVYLLCEGQVAIGGYTDATGTAVLPVDTSSDCTVDVTVTGHNYFPHQGSFAIAQVTQFVGMSAYAVDDGSTAPASGNGDGVVNPGETVALDVTLMNYGTMTATDVTLRPVVSDPYVWLATDETFTYGTISPGYTANSLDPIVLRISPLCPTGHVIQCNLQITSDLFSWTAPLNLDVSGADLVGSAIVLYGLGTRIDPGEMGTIEIELENVSVYSAAGPFTAHLASDSYAIQVTDAVGTYGTIPAGASGSNGTDHFGITSPSGCVPGQLAHLRLLLTFADGTHDEAEFSVVVGAASSEDPTGPDAYGYYAYDNTDTSYPEAPTYAWIDIAQSQYSAGLTDYGWQQDDSRTFDLPFDFQYYGQTFDQVTICSNGWIAMGQTYLVNYRNWYLPSAGGPAYIIAPFWDNLYQVSSDRQVFHKYDEANHIYIVSWDQLRNNYNNSTESFQVVLYDPVYYPTGTGDGEILFAYEDVNDVDSQQMFATVGIADEDHTTGITMSYFHQRPGTAATLSDGRAYLFTTRNAGFSGIDPTRGPARLLLNQNQPNPWSAATTIRFQLPEAQPIELRVFDVDGRVVRSLHNGTLSSGPHVIDWSGLDQRGRPVPSGVYYYRLDAGDASEVKTMMLVR